MTRPTSTILEYYANPHVRQRIREYLGVDDAGIPSAACVAELGPSSPWPISWETARRRSASALEDTWTAEADLARSLRDSRALLFFLDLDYHNPDRPGDPFLARSAVFEQMEPAFRSVRTTLAGLGIAPLVLVTGRGYHFVGQIPHAAAVVEALEAIVPGETPDAAWAGLGCVVEHLAHLTLRAGGGRALPLVVNGLPVGPGAFGRAAVSIDFSYVGDPLDARFMRSAFATYQWHRCRPDLFGEAASNQPPLAVVPRGNLSLDAVLQRGGSLDAASKLARRSVAVIPDVGGGMEGLVRDYRASPLAAFHQRFHVAIRSSVVPALPADLPACVVASLSQPNDLLLKPEHLQHLVRTLLARGWEASQVATLVRRSYEADHGWYDRWERRMNPAMRAQFETRVFGGLVASGVDGLVDFNCVSAQEKGLCPRSGCSHDLRRDREALKRALV